MAGKRKAPAGDQGLAGDHLTPEFVFRTAGVTFQDLVEQGLVDPRLRDKTAEGSGNVATLFRPAKGQKHGMVVRTTKWPVMFKLGQGIYNYLTSVMPGGVSQVPSAGSEVDGKVVPFIPSDGGWLLATAPDGSPLALSVAVARMSMKLEDGVPAFESPAAGFETLDDLIEATEKVRRTIRIWAMCSRAEITPTVRSIFLSLPTSAYKRREVAAAAEAAARAAEAARSSGSEEARAAAAEAQRLAAEAQKALAEEVRNGQAAPARVLMVHGVDNPYEELTLTIMADRYMQDLNGFYKRGPGAKLMKLSYLTNTDTTIAGQLSTLFMRMVEMGIVGTDMKPLNAVIDYGDARSPANVSGIDVRLIDMDGDFNNAYGVPLDGTADGAPQDKRRRGESADEEQGGEMAPGDEGLWTSGERPVASYWLSMILMANHFYMFDRNIFADTFLNEHGILVGASPIGMSRDDMFGHLTLLALDTVLEGWDSDWGASADQGAVTWHGPRRGVGGAALYGPLLRFFCSGTTWGVHTTPGAEEDYGNFAEHYFVNPHWPNHVVPDTDRFDAVMREAVGSGRADDGAFGRVEPLKRCICVFNEMLIRCFYIKTGAPPVADSIKWQEAVPDTSVDEAGSASQGGRRRKGRKTRAKKRKTRTGKRRNKKNTKKKTKRGRIR